MTLSPSGSLGTCREFEKDAERPTILVSWRYKGTLCEHHLGRECDKNSKKPTKMSGVPCGWMSGMNVATHSAHPPANIPFPFIDISFAHKREEGSLLL